MRVGKSVWYAKRISPTNSIVEKYDKPIEIVTRFNYFTVMPVASRGLMEVIKSGEALYDTWTATANDRYFDGKFNAGDLFWLDGDEPPKETDISELFGYKDSATAIVKNVSSVNFSISIRLERNQNKEQQ